VNKEVCAGCEYNSMDNAGPTPPGIHVVFICGRPKKT
jgi:hypothetical protein